MQCDDGEPECRREPGPTSNHGGAFGGVGAGRTREDGDGTLPDDLDPVWRALSNATRRHMLDLLKAGPLTTGDLSERFDDLSRFAVMQHLRVLEDADLVVPVRDGRKRFNYLNPVPIQRIYDRWVSEYMQPWTDALTSLKHALERRDAAAPRVRRHGRAERAERRA